MKPETKPILEGISKAFAAGFDLAFNAIEAEEDEGEVKKFTAAELFAKVYEMMKVGEKRTISASISIVRTGNFAKPQHKVKVSVTMKAATPDDDYQDLFDFADGQDGAQE